jgi:hypothetical protein
MLKGVLSVIAGAVVFATIAPANAFTLTNHDTTHYEFTIYVEDEDDEWNITIQAKETLTHLCASGCSISIKHGEEKDFQGYEVVWIVDGRLRVAE